MKDQLIEVRLADFKARLSAYLRRVRRGQALTILNRDTPVARVVPYEPTATRLPVRPPSRRIKEVRLPPSNSSTDGLGALLEERQRHR